MRTHVRNADGHGSTRSRAWLTIVQRAQSMAQAVFWRDIEAPDGDGLTVRG